MKQKVAVLSPTDNVATALVDLKVGDTLVIEVSGEPQAIKLTADVPFGHKFSLSEIKTNSPVIKYGEVIGLSTATIKPGDYVHIHNVISAKFFGKHFFFHRGANPSGN